MGGGAHVGCTQRFWFSHTKEGTCLVKCSSPNVVASCKPPSPPPALPSLYFASSFLSFRPSNLAPARVLAHSLLSPPCRACLFLTIVRKERRKEEEKKGSSTMVSAVQSLSFRMLIKICPLTKWCMLWGYVSRIRRREWPCVTNANSSSWNLRRKGASASSCSRSMRRSSRWWWTGWGSRVRAMTTSLPAYQQMSAATRYLILTLSLMKTARRARYSSSPGNNSPVNIVSYSC